MEKTGTTTIQEYLHVNRESLIEKGFYFMRCTGLRNDRKLSAYCLMENEFEAFHKINNIDSNEKKKDFEQSLKREIHTELKTLPPGVHTVIFSSEHFHSRVKASKQRKKLKDLICEFFEAVNFLVYIRPQIDVAVSHYSTYLKRGSKNFNEYLERCNSNNYYYNYYEFLDGWQQDFTKSDLTVRVFQRSELVEGDVVADMAQAIGLDTSNLKSIISTNESLNPTGQECLRAINHRVPSYIKDIGFNPMHVMLVNTIREIFSGSGQKPNKIQAQKLQEEFNEINEIVRERFFPEKDTLFAIDFENFDEQEAIEWGVVNFFCKFVDKYKQYPQSKILGVSQRQIDILRDTAVKLEKKDMQNAEMLMHMAFLLRPSGKYIYKKLCDYRSD